MRALVCRTVGSYEDLEVLTVDDPTPGSGEVLVDVAAAGVNFPDLLITAGKYQFKPDPPFSPGGEVSGRVAAVGPGVEDLEIGSPVIAMGIYGGFAEKMIVSRDSVVPKPPELSFEAAAGVAITYGTSYYALKQRAALQAGETLLVLGAAGGVGTAAVELGKRMGARVLAAASSDAKLEVAREAGADEGINYLQEDLKSRVKELTGGAGADVVYDPVGGAFSEAALRATAWNGRLLVVGFAAGEIPRIPLNLTLLKGASVVGVFWGSWIKREPGASAENYRQLAAWFASGELRPRITALPLDRGVEALRLLAERKATGKIVLTME